MNLKKNEYDQKSKQAEIEKLSQATQNTEVRSEIDGVVQKIDTSKMGGDSSDGVDDTLTEGTADSSDSGSGDSSSNAFITILSTGAYRVKGTVNEVNRDSIIEGTPVIIRSRVDASKPGKGQWGPLIWIIRLLTAAQMLQCLECPVLVMIRLPPVHIRFM